jgi:hypothetical protein
MIIDLLKEVDGRIVTIVRPFFGNQSDSFIGHLSSFTKENESELTYHFTSEYLAMLFKLDDVISVTKTPSINSSPHSLAIIRLKGPSYYGACLTA